MWPFLILLFLLAAAFLWVWRGVNYKKMGWRRKFDRHLNAGRVLESNPSVNIIDRSEQHLREAAKLLIQQIWQGQADVAREVEKLRNVADRHTRRFHRSGVGIAMLALEQAQEAVQQGEEPARCYA